MTAPVTMGGGESRAISYELPIEPPVHAADAFLPATLMPAMALRDPPRFEAALSPRLLTGAATAQDILGTWAKHAQVEAGMRPPYEPVTIEARKRGSVEARPPRGAACFFTAGVDSFYSALKHRDELDALVYVHGFDVPLGQTELRERVARGVRSAASELGLRLIEVETDVADFARGCLYWEDFHGAALASVALLLGAEYERVYLPATMSYALLNPLGSHPLLDPLWSTEDVEIVHDGCEATRREKLRAIAGSPAARGWLRVCFENRDGDYNCGRCEKCVRTQAALRLLGVEGEFMTLPPLDLQAVRDVRMRFGGSEWRDLLHHGEVDGSDPELTGAIRAALLRHRLGGPVPDEAGQARPLGNGRVDELELLAVAAAVAAERDRLAERVRELEGSVPPRRRLRRRA